MGSFLTRVLRSGMLPIPAAPRPRSQPPLLALEVNRVAAANATEAPKRQAPSPLPSRENDAAQSPDRVAASIRGEPQAPINPSRALETPRVLPSPPAEPDERLQPGPPAARPALQSFPSVREVPTFVVPSGLTPLRPLLDLPQRPASAEAPTTFSARRMSEAIGAAPLDEGASAGPSIPMRDDAAPAAQDRSKGAREALRDDTAQAEMRPSMPMAAPAPLLRVEVTSVRATPPVHAQGSEARDPVQAPAPRTSPEREAARSPQAQAAPDVRPSALPGGRTPAPARRDAAGAHLTVNTLNVQVVNEERPTRKPPRSERASAPRPPEDWARFGRQHLRIP